MEFENNNGCRNWKWKLQWGTVAEDMPECDYTNGYKFAPTAVPLHKSCVRFEVGVESHELIVEMSM